MDLIRKYISKGWRIFSRNFKTKQISIKTMRERESTSESIV